jgi:DNA-binding Lrp family transcriptional regulator
LDGIEPFLFSTQTIKSTPTSKANPPHPKIGETKMPKAYILLNTEIGAEKQVLKALKKIQGVAEAYSLWGVYDIIANIKAGSTEEVKYIITSQIEKINKINSKLTMIVNDKLQTTTQQEQMIFENPLFQ